VACRKPCYHRWHSVRARVESLDSAPKGVYMIGEVGTASVVLLVTFTVLSAFFSGSEAALLSVQRIRIQHLARSGAPGAARVAKLVERPDRLLPPILLGNNLANTAVAALATAIAITLIEDESKAILIATAVVTVVLLILGETIPKTAAARHAERASIIVAIPIVAISWLLFPISFVLQRISNTVIKLLGSNPESQTTVTEEEIKAMVSFGHEEGAVDFGEAEMILRVLEFGDRLVREVMTPRPEIIWVEQGITIRQFLALYNENYHTRFPVYQGTVDNVVGLVAVKDVMRLLASGVDQESSVTSRVRPAVFIPETKRIQELFDEMRASGEQIAMIADEFGGVAGLVTLKRLVEDIVGRVGGEDEVAPIEVVEVNERTFDLDASMSIAEVNDRLELAVPVGDYETLAGFLLEQLGKVPEVGDELSYGALRFAITAMQGVRISGVRVESVPPAE
jgi:putative hemolysin